MSDKDLRLSAWLDGALSPEEAAAFEAELERDPELAEHAANWRGNDHLITAALAPVVDEPIGDDMLARMGLSDAPALPLAANDNPPWWHQRWLPVGGAIAAGLALVAVMLQPHSSLPQDGGLSLALETTPALQQAKLADGRVLEPQLTARAADGRWCREYRIGDGAGLACRDKQGWKIEAQGKAAKPATSGDIQLAGGESSKELDAANARLGTADPLGADAERALIANGWGDR